MRMINCKPVISCDYAVRIGIITKREAFFFLCYFVGCRICEVMKVTFYLWLLLFRDVYILHVLHSTHTHMHPRNMFSLLRKLFFSLSIWRIWDCPILCCNKTPNKCPKLIGSDYDHVEKSIFVQLR